MVYVISQDGKPLMPCSDPIARLLLKQGKAKVKKREPFTAISISLLSVLSPLALDPNKITLLIEYFFANAEMSFKTLSGILYFAVKVALMKKVIYLLYVILAIKTCIVERLTPN